ncbi:MAG: 6-carboxytetrahydropterin synthase QueD [Anaerolineaceae bacterium]|nr:6-carboxytetrahydropterin synthase QueD [Anaerolineaceae bacterium]
MAYELTIKMEFGAAHHLRQYKGKCERLHGHNWKVDIHLSAEALNEDGMVVDFVEAKTAARQVLERFDHYYLNEVPPFDALNPTSENIARVLAEGIQKQLPDGVRLTRVTAWESDNCGATYIADGK